MHLRLLVRFHLLPWVSQVGTALRQGPLMAAVAGFLIFSLVGLTLAGQPLLKLPGDLAQASEVFVVLTVLLAGVLWAAGQSPAPRWRAFFEARPHGHRAWLFALAGRALGIWTVAALIVAGLSGPSPLVAAVALVAAVPFVLAAVTLGLVPPRTSGRRTQGNRLPGLTAWWVSQPLLFLVPGVLWLALLGWAASGQAGFAWGDRPPVARLLLDFGWPTVFGLLWSEVASKLPASYFRLARAPFRRVAFAVGIPVVGVTVVTMAVGGFLAWTPADFLRATILSATGTAFWFAYWLRWGPAHLAHLMLFVTLFLFGAAAENDWWGLWALLQTVGSVAFFVGWRTRYYEGETHARD